MMVQSNRPPEQWPSEVAKLYDPIRVLGVGGFASVMLARKKVASDNDENKIVAIKVVGSAFVSKSDLGYAHREIDILKEINHKNIMRVIDFWEPAAKEHKCAAVIALTYSKGPTVEKLINHGGALSATFGRVVVAQLCDATAYLHSRAVIHRDIKPDK